MARPINWTLSAREARQAILEKLFKGSNNKLESKKVALLIRIHVKYISKYNFAGVQSQYEGMRETTCGDYTLFYKIRSGGITVTGIFDSPKKSN